MKNINVFVARIYRIGFLLIVLLTLLDLFAYFYYPDTLFGDLFIATQEQTPLTWISALSFFFIGLMCMYVYLRNKKRMYYWLALLYFFFSVDDATYIHERISGYVYDHSSVLVQFPTYVWIVLYAPLLLFAIGILWWLLWKNLSPQKRRWFFVATLLLLIAVSFDMLDGYIDKHTDLTLCFSLWCQLYALHIMRLIEEVFEVVAMGIVGWLWFTVINDKEHSL